MKIIDADYQSHIVTWNVCLEEFFRRNKIFLDYPWRIENVYKGGEKFRVQRGARPERYANMPKSRILSMGAYSYCRTHLVDPHFRCGRYCSVATGLVLSDQEHPLDRISTHPFSTHPHMRDFAKREFNADWTIEPHRFLGEAPNVAHDVWIGANCLLKRGITIGVGAVIAARSVVTKDVEPYSIVGGMPAKLIRYRFDDSTIERLLASKWWEYNFIDFPKVGTGMIHEFLSELEEMKASGRISPFSPGYIDAEKDLFDFIEANKHRW